MSFTRRQILGGASAFSLAWCFEFRAAARSGPQNQSPVTPVPPEAGAKSLDGGWRFHAGDIVPPKPLTHSASYNAAKAGNALGAAAPGYDDGDWRGVDLPHDWAIEEPPVRTENLAQGYRKRGIGWYRRSFRLDSDKRGRCFELHIGAISTNATIWFNGTVVAHNWSGYNSIVIDLTSMAVFGDDLNQIAIRVDADAMEGWWYEGAGLYRHVWLIERAPIHIVSDGVHANPRRDDNGAWRVPVEVAFYSAEDMPAAIDVMAELVDSNGTVAASGTAQAMTVPLGHETANLILNVAAPRLWSTDDPTLYKVRTRLVRNGVALDAREETCGFRTIRFDAAKGFFLNDLPVKIKGVCIHQDHAGVGVAVPDALVDWRVRQLKAIGCNAIRSAHNAPSTALLDACDRHGMLVMDENRHFNDSPDYMAQLEWLVRRDRNRACVILWSIFNEEPLQGAAVGYEMARRMVAAVKALDDSRPVTGAMNSGFFTAANAGKALDVVGFNYQHFSYDRFHREFPGKPMLSSEDTSAYMTRGAWASDKAKHVMASDDSEKAIWGLTQRAGWKAINTRPFVAGAFVWTGFDYHGEPSPYEWPSNTSYFGLLDLCGFPKSAAHIRRALWVVDEPVVKILPHWNWHGREGEPVKVMVASNLEQVELRLNGRPVARGPVDPYDMATFDVPYAPGRLEVLATGGGRRATDKIETTGQPVRIVLTPDRAKIAGDGSDAVPVTIQAVDAKGRACPLADGLVSLAIANGRLIGVGNGDPTSLASGKESQVRLFNGLAQAIVQSTVGSIGALTVTATSDGLASAKARLSVVPGSIPALPPAAPRQILRNWRQSPLLSAPPATLEAGSDNDMNSWDPVIAGEAPPASPGTGFITLRATVRRSARDAQTPALIHFRSIAGAAVIRANGKVLARKADSRPGPAEIKVPAEATTIDVVVILEAIAGQPAGLPGTVFIERATN